MSGENAAVAARDKQIAWMVRNIEAMRNHPYPSDKRRKAQIMSRDLTLGAIGYRIGVEAERSRDSPSIIPQNNPCVCETVEGCRT